MTNGGFIVVCIIFAVVFFFAAGSSANNCDEQHGGCFLALSLLALWLMTCAIFWRVGYCRGINETETYHIIQSAQQGEVQK